MRKLKILPSLFKNSNDSFIPNILGLFTNPFYFARKGLLESIKIYAPYLYGDILDVGCGSKPYQALFKYNNYTGLDYDKGGKNNNPAADYFYDGGMFPFNNSTFDSCICTQVFEHVFDPSMFLKEIHRVLKIDGIFLITVPFVWDEHEQPFDYARYTSFGLTHALESHGFKLLMHRRSVNDIRVIFQLINTYIQKKLINNNNRFVGKVLTVFHSSVINIIGLITYKLLPKNDDLYLDNIVLSKKVTHGEY